MKKLYSILFLFLCLYQVSHAQSLTINYVYESCWGNTTRIGINMNGAFNSDNRYSVQVRQGSSNNIISERPAVYRNSNMEVLLDTLLRDKNDLMLRIVSTSPKTESNWIAFKPFSKGHITLLGAVSDTINHGDQLQLRYAVQSHSYVTVTLNDSSKHSLSNYGNGLMYSYITTNYKGDGPVFTAHAENSCGAVAVSGEVKPVLNSVSLRPVSTLPGAVCEGGDLKVTFSAQGNPFNGQTKFKIRLIPYNNASSGEKIPGTIEVTATYRDNMLVAQLPNTLQIKNISSYRIQIITELPSLVSSPSDFVVLVYPKAGAEFTSSSGTIDIGQSFSASINFTGKPPFSAELQDGTIVSSDHNWASGQLAPEKTTSYQIRSFTTGCGQYYEPPKQTLLVRVNPGIAIRIPPSPQVICLGSKVQLPFISNVDFNSSTAFYVNFNINGDYQLRLSAVRNGNMLEFTPPTHFENGTAVNYDYMNQVFISTSSPATVSQPSFGSFIVQSKPEIRPSYPFVFTEPGRKSLGFLVSGRGPLTIEDMDGTVTTGIDSYWNKDVFVRGNAEYKLKSVSNSCFRNDNPTPAQIQVNGTGNAHAIHIENSRIAVCTNDSVEVSFVTSGTFHESNTFTIQGFSDCCDYINLAVVRSGGKYKVKLPASQFSSFAYLRVAASNPVYFSESYIVDVQRVPNNVSISPESSLSSPFTYTDNSTPVYVNNNAGGYLKSILYNDGKGDVLVNLNTNQTGVMVSSPIGTTTAYTIKSVGNACGTADVNRVVYMRRIPYRIIPEYTNSDLPYCAGMPFGLSFSINSGTPGASARYSLQMFKEGSSELITLVKDQAERFFQTEIPAETVEGVYFLRVISSDGAISENRRIEVGTLPTATLSSTSSQPVNIDYGQSFELKTSFTGSGPWTLIYQDGQRFNGYSNPITHYISPQKSQDYEIKTIYNKCGYGTSSGKVPVRIKPGINFTSDHSNVCQGTDFNVTYQVYGDVDLSNDYIRFELIESTTGKAVVLDSTRSLSGRKTLRIPDVLSGNSYSLRATIRSVGVQYQSYVSVSMKAHLVISGNNVINPGDPSVLTLRNTKTGSFNNEVQFALSDGSTGRMDYYTSHMFTVSPTQTTTYTITSVKNTCGNGTMSGTATIQVNSASSRTTRVTRVEKIGYWNSTCMGDTVQIEFERKGTFSANNVFTAQISDTTGLVFRNITTIGNSSPLSAIIPSDLFSGKNYRIRITASDAGTGSSANASPNTFSTKAKARFASEFVPYDGRQAPKIVVLLEGGTYWEYRYGTDLNIQSRYTTNKSDTITLFQVSPNQYYKLISVRNECGIGLIENPNTVRVEVITSEPGQVVSKIVVAPNPVTEVIYIRTPSQSRKNVSVFDKNGILLKRFESRKEEEEMDVRKWATGIYILKVEMSGRTESFKVIRQ